MKTTLWTVRMNGIGFEYGTEVFAATSDEAKAIAEARTGHKAVRAFTVPTFS